MNDHNDKTRRAEGLLSYFVGIGLVTGATILLFSIASFSVYGTSKRTLIVPRPEDEVVGGKFSDTVAPATSNNPAPVAPAMLEVTNPSPAMPPDSLLSDPPGNANFLKTDREPPTNKQAAAAAGDTGKPPVQSPTTEGVRPLEATASQGAAGPIDGGVSVVPNAPNNAVPTMITDQQREQMFRDFEIQHNLRPSLDADNAANPQQAPSQNTPNLRADLRPLGSNTTFRDRVRRECGPILDPALYRQCVASFSAYHH